MTAGRQWHGSIAGLFDTYQTSLSQPDGLRYYYPRLMEQDMRFLCEVDISPRQDILDPQGDAVAKALANLGFGGIEEVKVGKYLTIALEAESAAAAQEALDDMCRKLLANPITEDYAARVKERAG